jgi:hypothetical protein
MPKISPDPGVPIRLATTPLRRLLVASGNQILKYSEVREYLRRSEKYGQASIAAIRRLIDD